MTLKMSYKTRSEIKLPVTHWEIINVSLDFQSKVASIVLAPFINSDGLKKGEANIFGEEVYFSVQGEDFESLFNQNRIIKKDIEKYLISTVQNVTVKKGYYRDNMAPVDNPVFRKEGDDTIAEIKDAVEGFFEGAE